MAGNSGVSGDEDYTPRERNTARLAFESLVSDDLQKFGFFQLANRLLLGLQGRYVLRIFVEYVSLPDHFFLLASSLIDYHYKASVAAFDREHCVRGDAKYWLRNFGKRRYDLIEDLPFARGRLAYVFEDGPRSMTHVPSADPYIKGYYFRIDTVKSTGRASLKCAQPDNQPLEFLTKVYQLVSEHYCPMFDMDLPNVMDRAVSQGLPGATLRPINTFYEMPTEASARNLLDAADAMARDNAEQLFDQEYARLRQLPINRFEGLPTRVLFHRKVFNRHEVRSLHKENDGYHFNSELVLPPSQKDDILAGLGSIANASMSSNGKAFSFEVDLKFRSGVRRQVRRKRYGNKDADEWFWSEIVTKPNSFFEELERPLQHHERLFADSCLVSGVLQYRCDIFDAEGERSSDRPLVFVQSLSSDPVEIGSAMRRDVCYHYLHAMLSTSVKREVHDMMVVPFRLNGAPYGSISTIFGVENAAEIAANGNGRASYNEGTFFRNLFFYRNIASSVNSNLRRDYLNSFLRAMRHLFRQALVLGKHMPMNSLVEELNSQTSVIQRFYPFERLEFRIGKGVAEHSVILPMGLDKHLYLCLTHNEFYSRFGSKPFLSTEHCAFEWAAAAEEVNDMIALNAELNAFKGSVN